MAISKFMSNCFCFVYKMCMLIKSTCFNWFVLQTSVLSVSMWVELQKDGLKMKNNILFAWVLLYWFCKINLLAKVLCVWSSITIENWFKLERKCYKVSTTYVKVLKLIIWNVSNTCDKFACFLVNYSQFYWQHLASHSILTWIMIWNI